MSDQSTRLGLPYIQPSQAQKHVTYNEALRVLDVVVQLVVQGFAEELPPDDPLPGACYALGDAPVGVWAGQGGQLALFDEDGSWRFLAPAEGWLAWGRSSGDLRVFGSSGWGAVPLGTETVESLGIGTAPDAVNRLAVTSDATLFNHAGGGHQLKINKAAAGETASLLFQSDWTGHAEMGLAGDTAFAIKVSADGVGWTEAMRADPGAQTVSWAPAGTTRMTLDDIALRLDVPLTGAAVQAGATDATPGRLMTVGAFGLGTTAPKATSDDLNLITAEGFYYADLSVANKPDFNNFLVLHIAQTAITASQIAISRSAATAGETWTRANVAGTWSAWRRSYDTGNLLGTVSQSGGVPTGAIIERGSNANGEYVKFADGTQICMQSYTGINVTTANGALFASASVSWTFPASFQPGTRFHGYGRLPLVGVNAAGAHLRTNNTITGQIVCWASVSSASQDVDVFAIGRWF